MMPRLLMTADVLWRATRIVTLVVPVLIVPTAARSRRNAMVTINGNGQECKPTVVPCNYAHMYSGTVSWTESTNGPAGTFNAAVGVTIKDGEGACTGSETSVSISQFGRTTRTGTISGKAPVAVEFDYYEEVSGTSTQPNRPMGYKVTVACPSADYPAMPDGSYARDASRIGRPRTIELPTAGDGVDPKAAERNQLGQP